MAVTDRQSKRTSINLRTTAADLHTIDRAAAAQGKSRTDFVLEASRREAEAVLLDRTFFVLDDAAYDAFVAQLDAPVPSTGALWKLLNTPAPWE